MSVVGGGAERPQATPRLGGVVTFRAYAALLVVFAHSVIYVNTLPRFEGAISLYYLKNFGAFGVDLFFVLSGFIICYANNKSKKSAADFLVLRLIRIFPIYLVVLVSALVVELAKTRGGGVRWSVEEIIASLLLIPLIGKDGHMRNIVGVAWTLSYEIIFYAAFATGIYALRRRPQIAAAAILLLVPVCASLAGPDASFLKNSIIYEFLLGMLVFWVVENFYDLMGLLRPYIISGCLIYMVSLCLYFDWRCFEDKQAAGRFIILGLPAAGFLIASLCRREAASASILSAIGEASYSLYLTHFVISIPLVGQLFKLADRYIFSEHFIRQEFWWVAGFLVFFCVVTSIGISLLFYRWIEFPLTAWLNRIYLCRGRNA